MLWFMFLQKSITKFAFHLSVLSGPTSQFLNGIYEFSELVLARMLLLIDQSHSVLPLRSAKAQEFGELWREKCTCALWTFTFKLVRNSSFGPGQNGQMERPKTRTWLLVSEILRLGLGCGGRTGVGLAGGVGAGLFFLRLPVLPSCARGLVSTASTSLSSVCCKSKKHHQQLTVLSKEASACWILTSYSYCCCHGVSLHWTEFRTNSALDRIKRNVSTEAAKHYQKSRRAHKPWTRRIKDGPFDIRGAGGEVEVRNFFM